MTPVAASDRSERVPATSWYALAILTVIHATHQIDRNVISVVVEPIKHEFHLTDAAMGLLSGMGHAAAFALFVLPLSWVADRVNRVKMITVVVGLWSALTTATALVGGYGALLLMRASVGASEAGGPAAMVSALADFFPGRSRPTAMGIYYAAIALGTGLIFALGGMIAHAFGWRAVFLVAGIPGLILAVLFRLTPPPRQTPRALLASGREVFGNRSLLLIILGGTFAASAQQSLWVWMSSFLIRAHDLSLAQAGWVVAASMLIGKTLGTVTSGPLTARLAGNRPKAYWRYSSLMLVLSVPLAWFMLLSPSAGVAIVCAVLMGFALGGWPGQAMSILLAGSPAPLRGSCVGFYHLSINLLGIGLGPLTTGLLSDAFGKDGLAPAIACSVSINILAAAGFCAACVCLPPDAAVKLPPATPQTA